MTRTCVSPEPLFFRVPRHALRDVMRRHSWDIAPDFLCFEAFYQAVASTWPKHMHVVDIGGAYGIQGWLFSQFGGYVCVDNYDAFRFVGGFRVGERCNLPTNGTHVTMDGVSYMKSVMSSGADTSDTVFVCSAVPNDGLRSMVSGMENSVVWYPGTDMRGSGPFICETVAEFNRLNDSGWEVMKNTAVSDALETDGYWKTRLDHGGRTR